MAIGLCNNRPGPGLVKKLDQLSCRRCAGDEADTAARQPAADRAYRAAKTRELRERLLKKGARWVEPSAEALATLDALSPALRRQIGELDNRGDTVELKTVQDWLARHMAVELKDVLNEMAPPTSCRRPKSFMKRLRSCSAGST